MGNRWVPWPSVLCALLLAASIGCLIWSRTRHRPPLALTLHERIDEAIPHAVRFLQRTQLPSGAFPGRYCQTRELAHCVEDVTPFVSTFVLHALSFLPPEETATMREQAVAFLIEAQHSPGIWSYWPKQNPRHSWTPPDLDDTACARAALVRLRSPAPPGIDALLALQTPAGPFWTWLGVPPSHNEIDCAVNANAAYALALEGHDVRGLTRYLNQVTAGPVMEQCSHYYLHPEAFCYFIARAYRDGGVTALQPAVAAAATYLQTRQRPDGGFGDTAPTAFAALTWLSVDQPEDGVERAVQWLLDQQRRDGGWGTRAVYARVVGGPLTWSFFGSEAMASALALEALAKARVQPIQ